MSNNESDLAKALSKEFPELTEKEADEIIDFTQKWIVETAAAQGTAKLHGFGAFTVKESAARKGRNPQTGEEIQIEAKKRISFKPYTLTKQTINQ